MGVSFLCACGQQAANTVDTAADTYHSNVATLGLIPDLSYEIEEVKPHIMVDVEGYMSGGKKVLFVSGRNLDKEFKLIDTESGETAYEGKLTLLSEGENEEEDLYMGEFTDLYEKGSYRAFQKQVGYSYEFSIGENINKQLYIEVYRELKDLDSTDNGVNCYRLAMLMFAHEIYPDAYSDVKYLRKETEKLLTQQDAVSKSVYAQYQTDESIEKSRNTSVENTSEEELKISLSVTAQFAGVMANYYHDFYENDPQFATSCLQAATQAYVSMVRYRDNVDDDAWYYAAASLYRATGNETYKYAISEYDALTDRARTASELDYVMLADMAYLNTEYRADYTRCEELMNEYQTRASDIADAVSRQTLYVREDIEECEIKEVLSDMMVLGMVDYVLSGGEYSSVKENYLHYYLGRNPDKCDWLKADSDQTFAGDIPSLSKLVFILGYGESSVATE